MNKDNQNISIDLEQDKIEIEIQKNSKVSVAGNSNYEDLFNKPKINGIYLIGDKTLKELGIQPEGEYLEEESDPTIAKHIKDIKEEDIIKWNNKSDFSGSYNDLKDKPTIPQEYILPIASKQKLGGIKPSDDFILGEEGEMFINQEVYRKDTIVNTFIIDLKEVIKANIDYTIPIKYKVGNNSLEVFYCSTKLQKRSRLYRNRRKWKCIKYNTIYRVSWRFRYDRSKRF